MKAEKEQDSSQALLVVSTLQDAAAREWTSEKLKHAIQRMVKDSVVDAVVAESPSKILASYRRAPQSPSVLRGEAGQSLIVRALAGQSVVLEENLSRSYVLAFPLYPAAEMDGNVTMASRPVGVALFAFDLSVARARALRATSVELLIDVSVFALGLLTLNLLLRRLVIRPVAILTDSVSQVTEGNLSTQAEVPSHGREIVTLATSFNRMVEEIQVSRQKLLDANSDLTKEIERRKEAEEALRQSEEKNRTILENTHDAFISIDENSRITGWNHQAEVTLGWTRDEAIGKRIDETIIPEPQREAHRRGVQKYLETGEGLLINRRVELSAIHKNGHELPIEMTIMALLVASQHQFSAFLHDISERKRHEEQLRNQADVLWNLGDGVVAADESLHITYTNPAFDRIYGYGQGEALGLHVSTLIDLPEAEARAHLDKVKGIVGKEGVWEGDVPARRRDGTEIIARRKVSSQRSGCQNRYLTVVKDMTDIRRNEKALKVATEELARSNKDLELFSSTASHDLQEPLRMVSSYLSLLKRRYAEKLDKEALEFLDFAVDGSRRMKQLIVDLLEYSRVGQKRVKLTTVDCNEVLREVLSLLSTVIQENGALITSDPLPIICGNRTQIVQLFQNLIGNGIKYHGASAPRLHISSKTEGETVTLQFEDNGIGIPKEADERIFEAFQRLHRTKECPGTGLGLATCKRIVEAHGGRIWVESEPGSGSKFLVQLRRAAA